jgi:hypothetical protein
MNIRTRGKMSHLYGNVDTMKFIATPEQLRARLELRRSNAAVPHKNKKAYKRKPKHKKELFD